MKIAERWTLFLFFPHRNA